MLTLLDMPFIYYYIRLIYKHLLLNILPYNFFYFGENLGAFRLTRRSWKELRKLLPVWRVLYKTVFQNIFCFHIILFIVRGYWILVPDSWKFTGFKN